VSRLRRIATVFVIGGIAGTICDQIHVASGVTVYADPILFGQPWYTVLMFGAGIVAGYFAAAPFAHVVHQTPPSNARLLRLAAIFLAAYFASALLHPHRAIAALVLHLTFFARALTSPAPLSIYALLVGAGGTAFEASLSALGAFHYAGSDVFGVPFWLPALYFHAAPLGLAIFARAHRPAV
jgi:hypothetical protein